MPQQDFSERSRQLQALTHINIQDFLESFGLQDIQRGRKALQVFCWYPARRFARHMVHFDHQVGIEGLSPAARSTLKGYVRRLEVHGLENIPTDGPLLVLSNHPGMADTLILFTSLPRTDLKSNACIGWPSSAMTEFVMCTFSQADEPSSHGYGRPSRPQTLR